MTTGKSFPYIKRRLEVIHTQKSEMNPLEVAILNMDKKIREMKEVLNRVPCDSKLLQMQLQKECDINSFKSTLKQYPRGPV